MLGMLGLGIGVAFGWSVFAGGQAGPPAVAWIVLVGSYVLVYLWGRRNRRGTAVATAVSIATATADAASHASAGVQVFIGQGASAERLDRLHSVSWRDDGDQLDRAYDRQAVTAGDRLDLELDDLDPVDLVERVRRGELEPGC